MATTKKKKSTAAKKTTSKKVTKASNKKTAAKKPTKKANATKKKSTASKTSKKDNTSKTWKVLSFVFVILIIVLLSAILMLVQEPTTTTPGDNTDTTQNTEDPEVFLTVVEDPACINCQVDVFVEQIKANLISNLEYEKLDITSSKGDQFRQALSLELVPAYLFSESIAQRSDWAANLAGAFIEETIGGETYYVLDPQFVQGKYLIDELPVTENTIVLGNPDAEITVYEFSDYECPFCAIAEGNPELVAQFQAQSPGYVAPVPALFENYVNTGKVRYVFYNFPLESIHPKARAAHNAGLCAYEQGADEWKEYNDMLFNSRNDWIESSNARSAYLEFAADVGLDETAFEECFDEQRYDSQIEEELQLGFSKGVSGTPGFFVGKHFLSGAQDYSTFEALIESELSN